MTAGVESRTTVTERWLAVILIVLWLVGAGLAHWLGVWMGIGSTALVLGTAVLAASAQVRRQLRPSLRLIGIGAAAGIVMIAATHILFPLAVRLFPGLKEQTAALYGSLGAPTPNKLAIIVFVILGEELVWRGAVQTALARRFGAIPTVLLAAVLYGAGHVPVGMPLLAVVALCCGLYWSALRALTGSLVAVLVTHILWDLTVMAWAPLVSRP